MPGTSASLAPSCAFISRSCSTICCSSTMHTANGTLSIIAPVISTQSPLPPTQAPCFETATVELSVLVRKRRVFGGTMSRRARRLRRGGARLIRECVWGGLGCWVGGGERGRGEGRYRSVNDSEMGSEEMISSSESSESDGTREGGVLC